MKLATSEEQNAMPAVSSGEFMHLPLNLITVTSQIRSSNDMGGDDFKTLEESIRQEGVIEPVVVNRQGDNFHLISGERRYRACQSLGLATIPCRILENVEAEKALRLQLGENLHRKDLNPLDEANAYVRYFRLRKGETPLKDLISIFEHCDLYPRNVDVASSQAVSAIVEMSGKSLSTLRRLLSLLNLPPEIRDALSLGKINVSQGYIFAEELDNPGLMRVFVSLQETPLTNEALKRRLVEARRAAAGQAAAVKGDTVAGYRRSFKNVRMSLQQQKGQLTIQQADVILSDLKELVALVEQLKAAAVLAAPDPGVAPAS